jgi:hypothetical protein
VDHRTQHGTSRAPRTARLIFALQRQIVATFDAADWHEFAWWSGYPELIRDDPELLAALRSDPAHYRVRVLTVLERLAERVPIGEIAHYVELEPWLAENDPVLHQSLFTDDEGTALADLDRYARELSIPELTRHVRRIRATVEDDPEVAIGQAKDMLETVMKFILDMHGPDSDIDVIKLARLTREKLGLNGGGRDTYRNRTLSNLTQLVEGINKLRNLYGTGHGRSRALEPDTAHARLVVDSAAALAVFFLEIDQTQRG